jgi:hypothetical protein
MLTELLQGYGLQLVVGMILSVMLGMATRALWVWRASRKGNAK